MADHNRPRVKSEVYYWDVGTLSWIPGVQGSGGGGGGGDASAANQLTEITHLNNIDGTTDSIDLKTPVLGQATMANSSPVVIASNQSAVPVTSTANLATVAGTTTAVGQGTANAGTQRVSIATDDVVNIGGNVIITNSPTVGIDTFMSGDMDTDAVGVYTGSLIGIAIPGNGGPVIGGSTSAPFVVDQTTYTHALEFDGSNNPIYIGAALQGSAKSASAWQIRKLTFDGSNNPTDIQFANGSRSFNAIWNNRAALTYS